MQTVLKDLPGVLISLDDIVVCRDSKEMHHKDSIPGSHVVSKEGLCPSPDLLAAISEAPMPKDMPALRSILSLISWFSRLLPNYATVVQPL